MTYAVVSQTEGKKILGMIWAEGEQQAQTMALNIYPAERADTITLKPTEIRELPLRWAQQ